MDVCSDAHSPAGKTSHSIIGASGGSSNEIVRSIQPVASDGDLNPQPVSPELAATGISYSNNYNKLSNANISSSGSCDVQQTFFKSSNNGNSSTTNFNYSSQTGCTGSVANMSNNNPNHTAPMQTSQHGNIVANSSSMTNATSSSPVSTRYPAKIHYKLNRSSPTNASSGCQTANNSPSTSNVSSPIGSDQCSPLVSPSANTNHTNEANNLYDINEEVDSVMESPPPPDGKSCSNGGKDFYPNGQQLSSQADAVKNVEMSSPSGKHQQLTDVKNSFSDIVNNNNNSNSFLSVSKSVYGKSYTATMYDDINDRKVPKSNSVSASSASQFNKGSVIELSNKNLKRIEDITTDDLMQSSGSNCLSFARVISVSMSSHQSDGSVGNDVSQKPLIEITLETNGTNLSTLASIEQPFISQNDGWVSASPAITTQLYGLPCQQIKIGSELLIGFTSNPTNPNASTHSASNMLNNNSSIDAAVDTDKINFRKESQLAPSNSSMISEKSTSGTTSAIGSMFDSSVASGPRSAFTPIPMSPSRHQYPSSVGITRKRVAATAVIDDNESIPCASPKTSICQTQLHN